MNLNFQTCFTICFSFLIFLIIIIIWVKNKKDFPDKLKYGKFSLSKNNNHSEFNFYKLISLVKESVIIEINGIYREQIEYAIENGKQIIDILLKSYEDLLKEKTNKKFIKDYKEYINYENLTFRVWEANLIKTRKILKDTKLSKMNDEEFNKFLFGDKNDITKKGVIVDMIEGVSEIFNQYYTGTKIKREELYCLNKDKVFETIFATLKDIFVESRKIEIKHNLKLSEIEKEIKIMTGEEK